MTTEKKRLPVEGETRGARITEILKKAQKSEGVSLYVSVINLGEVYYITMREWGEEKAEEVLSLIKLLPVQIIEVDFDSTLRAAKLKAKYPVAYADCFAASLAIEKNARVITGYPEFKYMENELKVEWV